MNKAGQLLALIAVALVIVVFHGQRLVLARLTGTNPTGASADAFCAGKKSAETCIDASGNVIPTTNNSQTAGTSALQFSDVETTKINNGGGALNIVGPVTLSGQVIGSAPAQQLLGTGGTISPICGGSTLIGATGPVTLAGTTGPSFSPTPSAGCVTNLVNTGLATISIPGVIGVQTWSGTTGTMAIASSGTANVGYFPGSGGNGQWFGK